MKFKLGTPPRAIYWLPRRRVNPLLACLLYRSVLIDYGFYNQGVEGGNPFHPQYIFLFVVLPDPIWEEDPGQGAPGEVSGPPWHTTPAAEIQL